MERTKGQRDRDGQAAFYLLSGLTLLGVLGGLLLAWGLLSLLGYLLG